MSITTTGLEIKSKFADENGEIMQIDLKGYIDQSNVGKLEKVIDDAYTSGCYNIVFNMEGVHYISSAGWGVFVGEIARFRVIGGDFRIAAMNPEVYQVFLMLEFYHILEDFETVKEAVDSFSLPGVLEDEEQIIPKKKKIKIDSNSFSGKESPPQIENVDKPIQLEETIEKTGIKDKSSSGNGQGKKPAHKIDQISIKSINRNKDKRLDVDRLLFRPKRAVPLNEMSLYGKIKSIVAEYPLLNIRQIKKMLSHKKFGEEKINIIKLYFILRELNLETKKKRYRFYRSI